MQRLTVVIPTRDRAESLARTLRALAGQDGAPPFEVVVASDALDADPAATAAALAASGLTGRHVSAGVPGASAARNAGWGAGTGDVVLFLDDDVLARPRLLAEHAAAHTAEPAAHVAVLGKVDWHPELTVTPFMRWLQRGVHFGFPDSAEGDDAGWGRFFTANVSVKRELLDTVGGFDEVAFPFHYEDLDFGRRAHDRAGMVLRYRPAALGDHLHAVTRDDYAHRLAGVAAAENRFTARYPDVPPFYRDLFASALAQPPARGTAGRLTRFVAPDTPILGTRVWHSFDLATRQALAPAYLAAWEAAASSGGS
jgi:GT2 family glycosyltransferase